MAWTTPRTWVASETVTAALMNTHIRDNLLETAPAKVTTAGDIVYASAANALARLGVGSNGQFLTLAAGVPAWATGLARLLAKAADESVTSDTTLQNDNHFTFAIGASEIWFVSFRLHLTLAAAGGFKFAFSVPSGGATGFMGGVVVGSDVQAWSTAITTGLALSPTNTDDGIWIEAVIINSTNAGNVVLQWAQNASNGTPTTVKANSLMRYGKLG